MTTKIINWFLFLLLVVTSTNLQDPVMWIVEIAIVIGIGTEIVKGTEREGEEPDGKFISSPFPTFYFFCLFFVSYYYFFLSYVCFLLLTFVIYFCHFVCVCVWSYLAMKKNMLKEYRIFHRCSNFSLVYFELHVISRIFSLCFSYLFYFRFSFWVLLLFSFEIWNWIQV